MRIMDPIANYWHSKTYTHFHKNHGYNIKQFFCFKRSHLCIFIMNKAIYRNWWNSLWKRSNISGIYEYQKKTASNKYLWKKKFLFYSQFLTYFSSTAFLFQSGEARSVHVRSMPHLNDLHTTTPLKNPPRSVWQNCTLNPQCSLPNK